MPPKSHKEVLEEIIKALDEGKRNIALSWIEELYKRVQFLENTISTSPTLLTPSDSDAKKALEIVEDYIRMNFEPAEIWIEELRTIRAAIFGLVAENKRLREIERKWNELEKQSENFVKGFEGVNWKDGD